METPSKTEQKVVTSNIKSEYKSMMDQKVKIINDLNAMINVELCKIVICESCKRKFANKAHYLRHITLSEFHKSNLNKKV
jgi:hypothetical protein